MMGRHGDGWAAAITYVCTVALAACARMAAPAAPPVPALGAAPTSQAASAASLPLVAPTVDGSTAAAALIAALSVDLDADQRGIRHDSSLAQVAEAAAWSASVDDVVSDAAVRNAMASALRSGVTPHVLTAWLRMPTREPAVHLEQAQLEELHATLAAALLELATAAPLESFTVSVRSGPAGVVAALVALEPPRLPLRVEHLGRAAVVTAPWRGDIQPVAYIVTPARAQRLAPARQGDSVKIVVPCQSRAGDLEVSGAGLFASVVDVCNPTEPRWQASTSDLGPLASTAVEIEQRSFDLLNRERRRHGLVPITWDTRAQAMARRQARDMAEHRFVSHVGSDGSTLVERLTAVALPAQRTYENVGRAGGPGEMHFGFMTSPGHRENLLAEPARAGGIGAAIDPVTREVYLAQVLYQPQAPAP